MNTIKRLALTLLEKEDCRIAVRKAGAFRFPSSYRYESHRHVEYEVNYVDSGKCVMTFDNEYVPLKAGECIIISPFHNHGFLVDAKNGCRIKQAEFSFDIPGDMTGAFPFSREDNPYYRVKDCADVAPLIEQMARFHRNEKRNDYGDTLLELAVTQLIVALGYHTGKTPDATIGIKNKKVLEIMQYIQRHISESIQIEEIAVNMKISSRCVRKHFAEEVGMSCSDYITMLRMNKAKKMLWETERTITEIAMETGYGTPQYFSRVFKNEMGMAPSAYRTSWREEK